MYHFVLYFSATSQNWSFKILSDIKLEQKRLGTAGLDNIISSTEHHIYLQPVHNNLQELLPDDSRICHIPSILKAVPWLQVQANIKLRTPLLVLKCLMAEV